MSKQILVLNGPNLGQLGTREPEVYGSSTYADLEAACQAAASAAGVDIEVRQTDEEATYLRWLHDVAADGVILNPGAWTHTSVAVRDAAAQVAAPIVEVHLSNPLAREDFRHTSYTAGLAVGVIAGFGLDSYRLAISALASRI
jgi:3-dehydroquinate dehydratase-2